MSNSKFAPSAGAVSLKTVRDDLVMNLTVEDIRGPEATGKQLLLRAVLNLATRLNKQILTSRVKNAKAFALVEKCAKVHETERMKLFERVKALEEELATEKRSNGGKVYETTVFVEELSDLLVYVGRGVWWKKVTVNTLYNQFAVACLNLPRPKSLKVSVKNFSHTFLDAEMSSSVERWNFWASFLNPLAKKKISTLLDLMRYFSQQFNRLMGEQGLPPLSQEEMELLVSKIIHFINHKLAASRTTALSHPKDRNKSTGYHRYTLRNQCGFVYPRKGPLLKDPFVHAFTEVKELTDSFNTYAQQITTRDKVHCSGTTRCEAENFVGDYLMNMRNEQADFEKKYRESNPGGYGLVPPIVAKKNKHLPVLEAKFLSNRKASADVAALKAIEKRVVKTGASGRKKVNTVDASRKRGAQPEGRLRDVGGKSKAKKGRVERNVRNLPPKKVSAADRNEEDRRDANPEELSDEEEKEERALQDEDGPILVSLGADEQKTFDTVALARTFILNNVMYPRSDLFNVRDDPKLCDELAMLVIEEKLTIQELLGDAGQKMTTMLKKH